jgi:hypothetical protein
MKEDQTLLDVTLISRVPPMHPQRWEEARPPSHTFKQSPTPLQGALFSRVRSLPMPKTKSGCTYIDNVLQKENTLHLLEGLQPSSGAWRTPILALDERCLSMETPGTRDTMKRGPELGRFRGKG